MMRVVFMSEVKNFDRLEKIFKNIYNKLYRKKITIGEGITISASLLIYYFEISLNSDDIMKFKDELYALIKKYKCKVGVDDKKYK